MQLPRIGSHFKVLIGILKKWRFQQKRTYDNGIMLLIFSCLNLINIIRCYGILIDLCDPCNDICIGGLIEIIGYFPIVVHDLNTTTDQNIPLLYFCSSSYKGCATSGYDF